MRRSWPSIRGKLVIAHLRGKLITKHPGAIVIDVGGVGYEVSIPLTTFYDLGEVGSDVSLRVHTHVREDALQLFGFRTVAEKDLFLKLVSVSGIGPKLAITVLSGMPASELMNAIRSNDLARLTAIPGVGRKTAERIVVELRDKLGSVATAREEGEMAAAVHADSVDYSVRDDAVAALVSLGYQKPVAERAVTASLNEGGDTTIEAVLKRSLKRLSR
ncbi:MAG TPA: Holliday junction branch migration protein RuvA [Blastocatellia bacterium]|nr:Holliday junction branch migration protein RuvA [Blastocatellia bacterium]